MPPRPVGIADQFCDCSSVCFCVGPIFSHCAFFTGFWPWGAQRLHRGRISKTQINVIRVKLGELEMDWPSEIQTMVSKNAPTVAECMHTVLHDLLSQLPQQMEPGFTHRVVLMVTADSLPTNQLASRILLRRLRALPDIDIRLIHWGCASHQVKQQDQLQ